MKALATKTDNVSSIIIITWRKKRINVQMLSPDLYRHTVVHEYQTINIQNKYTKSINKCSL